MYELVNTSVPNGLIAGTHGFATAAMTKGMPNAVRMRAESLCAYSHRTSVHDQTYWSENPINWFHLMLAGGDHAVGRTAPCEFDHTGRTNRISRMLIFRPPEMPVIGGAAVLRQESRRLSEAWSEAPRYLKDDRATVEQLCQMTSPDDVEPKNWIGMFGPQGLEYARRFAMLLAKNIKSGGKSIYFKTSTSCDRDGKKLLGLFSDLINLLPEDLSPLATFSTFSACVPSGVTCHLRGIYDKDRAFEVASALQPWVDCENGVVKHPELLPVENSTNGTFVDDGNGIANMDSSVPVRLRQGMRRGIGFNNRDWQDRPRSGRGGRHPLGWVLLGGILLAILTIGYFFKPTSPVFMSPHSGDIDRINQKLLKQLKQWEESENRELEELRGKIYDCKMIDRIENLEKKIKNKLKSGLKDSLINWCGNYQDVLDRFKDKYKTLLNSVEKKKREISGLTTPPAPPSDTNTPPITMPPTTLPSEDKTQADGAVPKSLAEPTIDVVIQSDENWRELVMREMAKNGKPEEFTNAQSIVYYYFKDNKCERSFGRVTMGKKNPRTGDPSPEFEKPDFGSSSWVVIHIPHFKKRSTYWQWNQPKPLMLFAGADQTNLVEAVFGGTNVAYAAYMKRLEKEQKPLAFMVYAINAKLFYCTTNTCLDIASLKPDQNKSKANLGDLEGKIESTKRQIRKIEESMGQADVDLDNMIKTIARFKSLQARKKEKPKEVEKKNKQDGKKEDEPTDKKSIGIEIRNIKKKAKDLFEYYRRYGIKRYLKGDSMDLEQMINEKEKNGKKTAEDFCREVIARFQAATTNGLPNLNKELADWCNATNKINSEMSQDWRETLRDAAYYVEVVNDIPNNQFDKRLDHDPRTSQK